MKKVIILSLITLLISNFAFARNGGRQGKPQMNPERILLLADELALSDEQVGKIEDIIYQSKKSMIPLEGKVKGVMLDIRQLMKEKDSDFRLIEEKIKEKFAVKETITINKFKAMYDIRQVLSDEQEKNLRKLMQQRRKKRDGSREKTGEKNHFQQDQFRG